jgi:hypothetical protein
MSVKIFKNIEIEEFESRFSDENHCLEFLASEKWQEGYTCRKCGNTNYCKGKTPHSRRCTRCKHDESASAHTMFHRCHLPLTEAFRLAYMVCNQPDMSSYGLSRQFEVRQMTCWKLKKKIEECLKNNEEPKREQLKVKS